MRQALILAMVVLAACGGDEGSAGGEPSVEDSRAAKQAAREAVDRANRERAISRTGNDAGGPREPKPAVLAFDSVDLVQESAAVDSPLRATAKLAAGASVYTEITYRWTVAGREVSGWRLANLSPREGKWKAGDWVEVVALAKDEKGQSVQSKAARIQVGNSTPIVLTDLKGAGAMSGVQMEARDPDGDPLIWSMKAPIPPGVSISTDGWIRVQRVDVEAEWVGEAVFVVSDPKGAKAEVHVPMTISATVAAKTEKKEVQQRADSRTLTDAEMIEKAEEQADRYGKMTDKEVEADVGKDDEPTPKRR